MSILARLFLFLLGAGLGGALLVVLELKFNHAWLPFALASAYGVVLAWVKWRPSPAFLVAHVLGLATGLFGLWLYSRHGGAILSGSGTAKLILGSAAMSGAMLLWSLIAVGTSVREQRKGAVLLVLLMFLFLAVAYGSSSAGGIDPFIAFFEHRLGLTPTQAETAAVVVRKAIHFLFYGFVAFIAARAGWALGASKREAILFGFFAALILAGFDEYRQSTTTGRGGSAWDVMLDLAGAAAFLCIPLARKSVRSTQEKMK